MKKIWLSATLVMMVFGLHAQGGRPNPGRRIMAEKDSVVTKITSLSDDQKLLVDAVYSDVQTSLEELMGTAREDREGFRDKMQAILEQKNALLKEIFNEEQWGQYEKMQQEARQRRQERRANAGSRRGRGDGGK